MQKQHPERTAGAAWTQQGFEYIFQSSVMKISQTMCSSTSASSQITCTVIFTIKTVYYSIRAHTVADNGNQGAFPEDL